MLHVSCKNLFLLAPIVGFLFIFVHFRKAGFFTIFFWRQKNLTIRVLIVSYKCSCVTRVRKLHCSAPSSALKSALFSLRSGSLLGKQKAQDASPRILTGKLLVPVGTCPKWEHRRGSCWRSTGALRNLLQGHQPLDVSVSSRQAAEGEWQKEGFWRSRQGYVNLFSIFRFFESNFIL